MLGQLKTKLLLAIVCMIFNHVNSSILIDPVPEDINLTFSENNSTIVKVSADIQPRKRDVSPLNKAQSDVNTINDEKAIFQTDSSHVRSARAIRPGFARIRGGFGSGGFRALQGRYNPYWGSGYNYPYRGWGGYGYYPYYYGGWPPQRPRFWRYQRPQIIIG